MTTKPKNRPSSKKYSKDQGALTEHQLQQLVDSALKPKKRRIKSQLFGSPEQEKPGVQVGNYSIRTVHDDGTVDFVVDWDRLREHIAQASV